MDNQMLDSDLAVSSHNLRDNSGRARLAVAAAWALFAVTIVFIVSNYFQLQLLHELDSGIYLDNDSSSAYNSLHTLVVFLSLGVNITLVVLFIMWFRRAYYNLHLTHAVPQYTEGWAVGAWFVPFINLVRPYTIMREIWVETQMQYKQEYESPSLIGWWWAFWLIGNVVANVSTRIALLGNDDLIGGMILSTQAEIASSVFDLIALWLAISMIRQTAVFEGELYDNYQAEEGPVFLDTSDPGSGASPEEEGMFRETDQ